MIAPIARVAALLILVSRAVSAQDVRGIVSDSATGRPLGGAVVALLDSTGVSLSRSITSERGVYRVSATPAARTMRVVRIGFRPYTAPYAGAAELNVVMSPIAPTLDKVEIQAAGNCPRRSDRLAALSLLQQARAGLLTAIVAREAKPATMVRLMFERTMDGDRIAHQSVRVDSSEVVHQSFTAVRSGSDFVRRGFLIASTTNATYLAPDAETLVDDGFAAGYCFHIADRDRKRPTEVGLAFQPASRQRDRIDVEGILWIDTVARALRNIEFKYVGLASDLNAAHPGGDIHFREMGNGVVLIDRWSLRLPTPRADTSDVSGHQRIRAWYGIHESGGEVALAGWPDGYTWKASLGTLRAQVLDYRRNLVRGVVVRLHDTDYIASPSARGIIEIPNLLPGPYTAVVIDSLLGKLGITVPTSLRFNADRDSLIQGSFTLPRSEDDVRDACIHPGANESLPILKVSVTTPDGRAVPHANVRIERDYGVDWMILTETRRTDDAGMFESCLRYRGGDSFQVYAWRDGEDPRTHFGRVSGRNGNTVRIELPLQP
jgi:hypothetical protein